MTITSLLFERQIVLVLWNKSSASNCGKLMGLSINFRMYGTVFIYDSHFIIPVGLSMSTAPVTSEIIFIRFWKLYLLFHSTTSEFLSWTIVHLHFYRATMLSSTTNIYDAIHKIDRQSVTGSTVLDFSCRAVARNRFFCYDFCVCAQW